MKVYESSHQNKRDYTKVPQIKIKNKKLELAGFEIGREFQITYKHGEIILKIIETKQEMK